MSYLPLLSFSTSLWIMPRRKASPIPWFSCGSNNQHRTLLCRISLLEIFRISNKFTRRVHGSNSSKHSISNYKWANPEYCTIFRPFRDFFDKKNQEILRFSIHKQIEILCIFSNLLIYSFKKKMEPITEEYRDLATLWGVFTWEVYTHPPLHTLNLPNRQS